MVIYGNVQIKLHWVYTSLALYIIIVWVMGTHNDEVVYPMRMGWILQWLDDSLMKYLVI